ncbi:GAF domain-containing protein [Nocardia transvalensis]|uniref:GAF domain-containing protein n=1 Tax=Nocardia transvalensis TaxID=37333 RepID=A0A7W9PI51_9NOCA|nr:GAF and ANTAR domain-containing protein [Nocardia transvalensis]MBB5916521.1 GAF domain-containing protein [Nocardia transvalensis]
MTDDLTTGITQLTALLLADRAILDSPRDIAGIVSGMLPGRPLVGVTLTGPPAAAGGSAAAHALIAADEPHHARPGPYRAAAEAGQAISIPDAGNDPRWPDHARRMRAHGVAAHEVWPLRAGEETIGTLSVYSHRPGPLDEPTRTAAAVIAAHLSVLLQVAMDATRRTAVTEQLRAALDSRSVIDQAVGILMGQRRCDRDAAFGLLRTASNRRNVKLAAIAAELVASIGGTPPGASHFDEPNIARRSAGRSG